MNYDAFLSAGLQLMPILWVLLAVETTWLRRAASDERRVRRWSAQAMATYAVTGTVAVGLALVALLLPQVGLKQSASLVLGLSIVASLIAAYFTLNSRLLLVQSSETSD